MLQHGHPPSTTLYHGTLGPVFTGQWCQATAVIIAVQHLYRQPPDAITTFLLQLAASI